jgi:Fe-S cluster biogenesis protein NfuA/nitrite reductase/ring-hydroxylating ferredoxin subunit
MADSPHLREIGNQVEALLTELRSVSDSSIRDKAEELVRLLVELYGAGLDRILEIIATERSSGEELISRLAGDEFVASLLMLHGLHPLSMEERVRQALDSVRPYLGSHAGGVELLGIDDDAVVHLALRGSCDGCGASAVTVKLAIERAIEEAAPEVTAVQVAGVTEPDRGGPTLLQIEPRPPDSEVEAVASSSTWSTIPGLDDLAAGELRATEAGELSLVVCRLDEQLYAYRDTCPCCGCVLHGAELRGEVLVCPSCQRRYNIRLAGRGVGHGDGQLEPLPLLCQNGTVRIALPAVGVPS